MTDERKKELAAELLNLLAEYKRRKKDNPMEFYRPLPHQARFHASQSRDRLFVAGNRAGKSQCGVAEDIRWALGLNPHRPDIPVPNFGWVVSLTNELQRDVLQPKFEALLPKNSIKSISKRRNGVWDQLLLTNGSVVGFKSCEMGASVMQGASLHWVHCDEEPDYPMVKELKIRLTDHAGSMWLTMTPVNGMCFDDKTEILTERGWSSWRNVSLGDLLASYNRKTKRMEWKPCLGLYAKHETGSMVKMSARGFSALVTENHKWVVGPKSSLVETKDLDHKDWMPKIAPWDGLPTAKTYEDSWVKLLAWVLTDGTFPKGKNSITIYQSVTANPKHVAKIQLAAEEAGCRIRRKDYPYHTKGEDGVAAHFHLYGKAVDFCKSIGKNIPMWFLRSLTVEQLKLFYETLLDGDGCRTPTADRFTQKTHMEIAHGFQALCSMLGMQSTRSGWYTNVRAKSKRRKISHVKTMEIVRVPYSGMIWCASNENRTLLARRDGTVYVTGNSWTYSYYVDKKTRALGSEIFQASMWDNAKSRGGWISDEEIAKAEADIKDPTERRIRIYGEYLSPSGLIYSMWNEQVHVIDRMPPHILAGDGTIREHFDTYCVIDTGRCFAAGFYVVDYAGNVIKFDEHYDEFEDDRGTINYRARMILNKLTKWGTWPTFIVDPSTQFYTDLSEHNINCQLGDNDVLKGISIVREYLAYEKDRPTGPQYMNPHYYVMACCERTRYEYSRYQWDKAAQSGSLEGEKKNQPKKKDDHCFVAGTMVATDGEDRPIEKLVSGDKVLTREGLKPVLHSWPVRECEDVYRLELEDGRTLDGTGDHKVWVKGHGWKELARLTPNEPLLSCTGNLPAFVKRVSHLGRRRVYNLTVSEVHEYFASGVLVKNCMDTDRMMLVQKPDPSRHGPGDGQPPSATEQIRAKIQRNRDLRGAAADGIPNSMDPCNLDNY